MRSGSQLPSEGRQAEPEVAAAIQVAGPRSRASSIWRVKWCTGQSTQSDRPSRLGQLILAKSKPLQNASSNLKTKQKLFWGWAIGDSVQDWQSDLVLSIPRDCVPSYLGSEIEEKQLKNLAAANCHEQFLRVFISSIISSIDECYFKSERLCLKPHRKWLKKSLSLFNVLFTNLSQVLKDEVTMNYSSAEIQRLHSVSRSSPSPSICSSSSSCSVMSTSSASNFEQSRNFFGFSDQRSKGPRNMEQLCSSSRRNSRSRRVSTCKRIAAKFARVSETLVSMFVVSGLELEMLSLGN